MAEETPELALPGEQLTDEVADVRGFHIAGLDPCRLEGRFGDVSKQLENAATLPFEVAGEVGLGAAQDEYLSGHVSLRSRSLRGPFRAPRCA